MSNATDYNEVEIARRGNRAERQVDKFFQRAPFLYGVLIALLAVSASGGAWTAVLQSRVRMLEDFQWKLEHDVNGPILEQAHSNKKDIDRNKDQIRELNKQVFRVPDP
jgi:hypothetical protein